MEDSQPRIYKRKLLLNPDRLGSNQDKTQTQEIEEYDGVRPENYGVCRELERLAKMSREREERARPRHPKPPRERNYTPEEKAYIEFLMKEMAQENARRPIPIP